MIFYYSYQCELILNNQMLTIVGTFVKFFDAIVVVLTLQHSSITPAELNSSTICTCFGWNIDELSGTEKQK